MKIREFLWPLDRVEHIAAHGISVDEFEEVCFNDPLVLRGKTTGENPVYYVLGQTESGRYLFCVVIHFPDGRGYPITAREMTHKEKRRFDELRKT